MDAQDKAAENEAAPRGALRRYSSRRHRLDRSFLCDRLRGAQAYDRIAGYFCSSLLEVAGEELEALSGTIRMVCNSELQLADVETARAAQMALRRSWCAFEPEDLLEGRGGREVGLRYRRLFELLRSKKLVVRVLPDAAFGLIHGKAGIITLAGGAKTCFMGSANESKSAWRLNYELVWEDTSPEAVAWVQEEFDALWGSPAGVPLADFVIEDIGRLAGRRVLYQVADWAHRPEDGTAPDPAAALIESPVYRKEVGLWAHQKHFVKLVLDAHHGPMKKARYVLADQVGLGKTLQLAMSAMLIALSGDKPILVICPKTLVWQWQGEMRDLLAMPSAVWDGRQWVDERGIEHGPAGIRRCPRRVGIVSSGLITRGSEGIAQLLNLGYDCVILDEAHRARRRNLGENRDHENPQPNNLLAFMYRIAQRARTVLLATATPVQLRPIEAWDLLDVLSRNDDSVLGNPVSRWRRSSEGLNLVMGRTPLPESEAERWDWVRNPMPPKSEHRDFEVLRRRLQAADADPVIPGHDLDKLRPPDRARLEELFPRFARQHNPFIRLIVRRTRAQLETQIDPETNEPLLQPIRVELLGEGDDDAIRLPPYLKEAYDLAGQFCEQLGARMKGAGFIKTLLLRRIGSSIHAGLQTARKLLSDWTKIDETDEEDDEEGDGEEQTAGQMSQLSKTLTPSEYELVERIVRALEANRERDPKYAVVRRCLLELKWLDLGCIVFSQYRDSLQWLAEQLSEDLPEERIAVYSGPSTSGLLHEGTWMPKSRDELKRMVMRGDVRLMLGTDAASEGINLQRLATLINLDLPWNPTRLEQRKGRIQRIGQIHELVQIYNMRYKDSVEDRVHQLLSARLHDMYDLFGQIPDVLEDVWIAVALGEQEGAKKIIDQLPNSHPFELRYTHLDKIDWESCRSVLAPAEKARILLQGW